MEKEFETEATEQEKKEAENQEEVLDHEEVSQENESSANEETLPTADILIQHQARQAEYVEKMNALLNKEDVTMEDIQTVEYVKSELLGQLLGVAVFSGSLAMDDSKMKGADALSTHLTNLYVKTALLREKMERKRLAQLEKMDVADAYFGPNQRGGNSAYNPLVITDAMLSPTEHQLSLSLDTLSPQLAGAMSLVDMVKDPETRLKAMLSDLVQEFMGKTSSQEKEGYSSWAETLVSGLTQMNSKGAMMNALQGTGIGNTLARMAAVKDIAS